MLYYLHFILIRVLMFTLSATSRCVYFKKNCGDEKMRNEESNEFRNAGSVVKANTIGGDVNQETTINNQHLHVTVPFFTGAIQFRSTIPNPNFPRHRTALSEDCPSRSCIVKNDYCEEVQSFVLESVLSAEPSGNYRTHCDITSPVLRSNQNSIRDAQAHDSKDEGCSKTIKENTDVCETRSNPVLEKFTDAMRTFRKSYEKRLEMFGENHPDTIMCKSDIAGLHYDLGEYKQAVQILKEVYEKRSIVLGAHHPDTIKAQSDMSYSYHRLGNHTKALQISKEVYEKRLALLGEDHPETLTSQANIACLYLELGKHLEALQMYENAYEKRVDILGEYHPETLWTRCYIANAFIRLGEHAKALRIYQEIYEKRVEMLGENHPDTIWIKNDIASLNLRL